MGRIDRTRRAQVGMLFSLLAANKVHGDDLPRGLQVEPEAARVEKFHADVDHGAWSQHDSAGVRV